MQAAVTGLFSSGRTLDHVYLAFAGLGSAAHPLRMPGLASAKTVRLIGADGCHIALDHDEPLQWRKLCIGSSGEVTLDLWRKLSFLRELEGFLITCKFISGPTCIQLTQEMGRLGRQVYCSGDNLQWSFGSFQTKNIGVGAQFLVHVQCGCHACLKCLHRDGKLPEGSNLHKGY